MQTIFLHSSSPTRTYAGITLPLLITMCTSSSFSVPILGHETLHARPVLTTPVPTRRTSEPQCCHCGWRGAHAPGCPFK
ncbi:hypothetical protein DFS33DRAFT_1309394 [Desarmillaria ectypa]|nr:hypothetical protein DFS33DRAFT_1309394 [Desarmillaria ectypa]